MYWSTSTSARYRRCGWKVLLGTWQLHVIVPPSSIIDLHGDILLICEFPKHAYFQFINAKDWADKALHLRQLFMDDYSALDQEKIFLHSANRSLFAGTSSSAQRKATSIQCAHLMLSHPFLYTCRIGGIIRRQPTYADDIEIGPNSNEHSESSLANTNHNNLLY